jgi:hypothetical protein
MNDAAILQDLVAEICASGRITAQDVQNLRREVFPDAAVSDAEASAAFRLDHACTKKDAEWTRFYVDALTDYFVWQSTPKGYVDDRQAAWLIAEISRDGRVDTTSELELLINVVHWCTSCPEALAQLALQAVKESVLTPEAGCYDSNRQAGVITPGDVELIRKVIYAPGSPGGFTVTRGEAELLVELDRTTAGVENAPDWPDLFAKSVANALMFPRGAPVVPDASEAIRRERWLESRRGIGQLLLGIGRAVARGDLRFGKAARTVDPFGTYRDDAAAAAEKARVAEALQRETIDAEEARWLVAHYCDAEHLSDGVIRLLRFIRENAPVVDPALNPLFERAGV